MVSTTVCVQKKLVSRTWWCLVPVGTYVRLLTTSSPGKKKTRKIPRLWGTLPNAIQISNFWFFISSSKLN